MSSSAALACLRAAKDDEKKIDSPVIGFDVEPPTSASGFTAWIQLVGPGIPQPPANLMKELAVFASVMSDLVLKETFDGMFKVYTSMRLPTAGPVTMRWSVQAIKAFLIPFLMEGNLSITGMMTSMSNPVLKEALDGTFKVYTSMRLPTAGPVSWEPLNRIFS